MTIGAATDKQHDSLVLVSLREALASDPERKCFRMIGGVLVERTVKDVVPALETNKEGVGTISITDTTQTADKLLRYLRSLSSSLNNTGRKKKSSRS